MGCAGKSLQLLLQGATSDVVPPVPVPVLMPELVPPVDVVVELEPPLPRAVEVLAGLAEHARTNNGSSAKGRRLMVFCAFEDTDPGLSRKPARARAMFTIQHESCRIRRRGEPKHEHIRPFN
jgi:hypothetical protein